MKRIAAILAFLVSSCASGGDGGAGRPSGPASLLRTEDLPARQREVLETWHRGGAEWELERERVALDPELTRFLVDNLIVEMVRGFDRSAIATDSRPNAAFDRAQAELVRQAQRSTPVLVELLGVPDGIVAFLAADTLKRIGRTAVLPVAERLAAKDAEIRRRAAALLEELPNAGRDEPAVLEKLAACVERDGAWIVRAQAARALGARGSRHEHKGYASAVLARALADSDPEVVKSALEGLATLGEAGATPALIRSLERAAREGDLPRLRASQAALRRLTGENRDHDPEEWWERWRAGSTPVQRDPPD
jgi:hypothetical protein